MQILKNKEAKKLNLKYYFTGKPCKYGHISKRYTKDRVCQECKKISGRKYYKENKDWIYPKKKEIYKKWYSNNKDKKRDYRKRYYNENSEKIKQMHKNRRKGLAEKDPEKLWVFNAFHDAKKRAKKKNLEFSLEKKDLIVPEYCPVLNIKLKFGVRIATDESPSIDRIDNTKGYTKDNICIISRRANSIKSNASFEEINLILKYIKKNLD